MSYIEQIDKNRIPQHIAIIMDGNGRWAKQRGKERTYGHHAGAETVQKITEDAARLGIKYLTLYTFSTENWNRPQDEIAALMNLLLESIEEETLMKNNIRFNVIGDFKKLPVEVQKSLTSCIKRTSKNSGMYMVLALSYSSRWEITEAVRQIATQVKAGEMSPEQITDECISSHLDTNFMPDPDLLIRTGGEIRLSNYLFGNALIRSFIFVTPSGPTSTKKNSTRPFGNTNKGNADSAKPVNRSANITRNIKL